MKFLGLYREPEFSPGRHSANDSRILRLVAQALERDGASVRLASLEEARSFRRWPDLIFSMCQGPLALAELVGWKEEGLFVLNDPEAARRTYRDHLCATLQRNRLGFPHSVLIESSDAALERCEPLFARGAWLKRADVHATQPDDVVYLKRFDELSPALKQFSARGLKQAVLQEHVNGDEVKFYAVCDGGLFWPYYPKESEGYPFDGKTLAEMAERAAGALGVGIYGGDAIISADGRVTLIDLNDWPSFAPCRGAAAGAIAWYLQKMSQTLKDHERIVRL